MNATLVRRILGLILTALLLVGIFVLAATSAAAQRQVRRPEISLLP
jgi:hypothetical protein